MDYLQDNFISQGGPVMYPLLFISLLGFLLFVERSLFLHKGQIGTQDFLSGIKIDCNAYTGSLRVLMALNR